LSSIAVTGEASNVNNECAEIEPKGVVNM